MCTCICANVYLYTHVYSRVHATYMFVWTYVRAFTCIHSHMYVYVLCRGLQDERYLADFWKHKRQAIFYERIKNVPKALAHVEMAKQCLALVPFSCPARIRAHSFKRARAHTYRCTRTTELLMHMYARTRRKICSLHHIDSGFFVSFCLVTHFLIPLRTHSFFFSQFVFAFL
jgi:hypothetical protein